MTTWEVYHVPIQAEMGTREFEQLYAKVLALAEEQGGEVQKSVYLWNATHVPMAIVVYLPTDADPTRAFGSIPHKHQMGVMRLFERNPT